ncbi:SDR family NAD(P)-dependent oxidoreductase [Brevibacillus antibioticus]|uniref:SDR family NAD(P)-dependent oxidoreductase n=1 Tax=Brevibacillus antibioticus TaxID=2570228 RepID=A0A4U2Y779_9BACL|nr:SDR family NAD(P)-dependent oxidoreductase [Brevibacillus antibioticus]TKI55071.1 SDR family NAD(P)-dependent oxidoreductase [Brevibacillus antibioticus]
MLEKLLGVTKDQLFSNQDPTIQIESITKNEIAVIGMSGKFGKAENLKQFWDLIKKKTDFIGELDRKRKPDVADCLHSLGLNEHDVVHTVGAFLPEIDKFDPAFFNISPKEASLMDPQQRLFLETVWAALEDGGYGGKSIVGSRTGIYVGYSESKPTYESLLWEAEASLDAGALAGNVKSVIASRIAYLLDLRGPCLLVDTACSSSLVAIHLACQAIRQGEVEMAVAGGVKLLMVPQRLANHENVGIQSSDGRARSFDHDSEGTGTGEGIGAVLLKPLNQALADNDHIYAVIKGSAINNDGTSLGITAPNALAQEDVLIRAWEDAGINPETISYIEAHGTGTKLGDPIEIDGLCRAFRKYTDKAQFCAISSAKSNIGHLDNTAGIAGFIKAVLALYHKQLPPMVHFQRANQKISFIESPVYIQDHLSDWDTDENPRRCGVSAFGLSGTNCHVLLEEAPDLNKQVKTAVQGKELLAFSAKNEERLRAIISHYLAFLSHHPDVNLHDLGYTVTTGRKHHTHRIAILTDSIARLQMQMEKILLNANGLKDLPAYDVSYGLSASAKQNEPADPVMTRYTESGRTDAKALSELARMYVQGADVDWESLYGNQSCYRISLPTYPFERKRCWFNQGRTSFIKTGWSRLIDKRLVRTKDQDIYATEMNVENDWLLNEHRFGGQSLLVGTAYLEMGLQAFWHTSREQPVRFKDLTFLQPMYVQEEETREVHTILKQENNQFTLSILSKSQKLGEDDVEESEWIEHAEGHISAVSHGEFVSIYSLDELKQDMPNEVTAPGVPEEYREQSDSESTLHLGARWYSLQQVHSGDNKLLAFLELPDDFTDDLHQFCLHPPLLDTALNLKVEQSRDGEFYFPFHFKEILVFSALPKRFYSYIRQQEAPKDTLIFDITLLDEQGQVLVDVTGYMLKKGYKQVSNPSYLNRLEWEQEVIVEHVEPGTVASLRNGRVLVITATDTNDQRYLQALQEAGADVIVAELSETQDMERLLQEMDVNQITHVLHMYAFRNSHTDDALYNLFHLVQALHAERGNEPLELLVLTKQACKVKGSENELFPAGAALFGLTSSIRQEFSEWRCSWIDTDDTTPAEYVLAEFDQPTFRDTAYRDGVRYIRKIIALDEQSQETEDLQLQSEGVYLITGGTGGIGLEIARYLSRKQKVKLALLNRTPFPPRSHWDELLDCNEDNQLCQKINTLREIEQSGSEILLYSGDVTSEQQMQAILFELRGNYRRINGVIHCAGVAGEGLLLLKEEQQIRNVVAPKTEGTRILDKLTRVDEPDFFLLCSSVTSLMGRIGQSDYAAANAFLDAYADYRNQHAGKTLTINWPSWIDTGMTVTYGVNYEDVVKPIEKKTAIAALDSVLSTNLQRVIVGEINYTTLAQFETEISLGLSEGIAKKLAYTKQKLKLELRPMKAFKSVQPVKLKGREYDDYTTHEKLLAEVWANTLGLEEIDIHNGFYDLGGDSIYAMKIVNHFNKQSEKEVSLTDILEHQNIFTIAKHLDNQGVEHSLSGILKEAIKPAAKQERYPATTSQKRIFVIQQFVNTGIAYNIPKVMRIDGKVDPKLVEDTIRQLIERHEILRTTFEIVDGEICQIIHDHLNDFALARYEASEEQISDVVRDFIQPFDLKKGPLFRVGLLHLAEEKNVLLFDFNHTIMDWASYNLFILDFCDLYQGKAVSQPAIQFKDFAIWQRQLLHSPFIKQQEQYWLDTFSEPLRPLQLPTDYPRAQVRSFAGDRVEFAFDQALTDTLCQFASNNGTTIYMVLLALYNILLMKYSGTEDIVVGSAISGRRHVDLEEVIGMFVNTLAIRNQPQKEMAFREFIQQVKEHVLKAYDNQDYPIEELVGKLQIKGDMSRNPLFDTMFIFENIDVEKMSIGEWSVRDLDFDFEIAKFDLTLYALQDQVLKFSLEYCSDLYAKETVTKMGQHFIMLTEQALEQPDRKLSEISFMTDAERQQLQKRLNRDSTMEKAEEHADRSWETDWDGNFNF